MAAARLRFEEVKRKQNEQNERCLGNTSIDEFEHETCTLCLEALEFDFGYVASIHSSKVLAKNFENPEHVLYL
jgi:hypothetical protein